MIIATLTVGQFDQVGANFLADPDVLDLASGDLRLKPLVDVDKSQTSQPGLSQF